MLKRLNRILIISLLTAFVFPIALGFYLAFRREQISDNRIIAITICSGIAALVWCALNVKSDPQLTRIALWIIIATIILSSLIPSIT